MSLHHKNIKYITEKWLKIHHKNEKIDYMRVTNNKYKVCKVYANWTFNSETSYTFILKFFFFFNYLHTFIFENKTISFLHIYVYYYSHLFLQIIY